MEDKSLEISRVQLKKGKAWKKKSVYIHVSCVHNSYYLEFWKVRSKRIGQNQRNFLKNWQLSHRAKNLHTDKYNGENHTWVHCHKNAANKRRRENLKKQ